MFQRTPPMPHAQYSTTADPLWTAMAAAFGVLLSVAACAALCTVAPDMLWVSLCTAHGRAMVLVDMETGAALSGFAALTAQFCPHCALVGATGGAAMAALTARLRLTHIKAGSAV